MSESSTGKREGLSKAWQKRFEILDKIDGDLFRWKELPLAERMKVGWRFYAFLFGIFYYFAKGMWGKGLLILIAANIVGIVLELIGLPESEYLGLLGIGIGAVCSTYATTDYYKKIEHNEKIWPFLSNLPETAKSIPVLAVAAVFTLGLEIGIASGWFEASTPKCGAEESKALALDIVKNGMREDLKTEIGDFVLNQPFELRMIRMTEYDEPTGNRTCAADLYGRKLNIDKLRENEVVLLDKIERIRAITYKIYPAEDDYEFIVEVLDG